MALFIKVENGNTVNHPAFEENLIQAFGQIPADWEPFVRLVPPTPGVYEELDFSASTYQKINGVWTDVWALRQMTPTEKFIKQQTIIANFNSREQIENWSAWTFDEVTCKMVPPVPPPALDVAKLEAGILTEWCGAENAWKDTPARPVDGNQYKFDFLAWQWVQVVN